MNRMDDHARFVEYERHMTAIREAVEGYHCYDTEPLGPIGSEPITIRVALEPQSADEPLTFKEQALGAVT
jgi:hypothetical protein